MEAFHVESDRTDLVVITIQEYRDLITAAIENKAKAELRLNDLCAIHDKAAKLEAKNAELEKGVSFLSDENAQLRDFIKRNAVTDLNTPYPDGGAADA